MRVLGIHQSTAEEPAAAQTLGRRELTPHAYLEWLERFGRLDTRRVKRRNRGTVGLSHAFERSPLRNTCHWLGNRASL
ncbi:MAG TPA: hypothetical protein VJN18_28145, partial [Polyangiaceae bacterium]|nr:hypothetical protein [Polyangiaceae bacterium]